MGTLTGDSERLPGLCEHKLPTSCRLSSIPNCCACADERPHSATYRTYIDGIGYVPRGTRWQRYCWFCKEFWENRVAATSLTPEQTRVPDFPDQSDFLEKWYEFHRGHRVITSEDGIVQRIAVLGEAWGEVAPGKLPRTLEELRAGERQSRADRRQVIEVATSTPAHGPSIDEALDDLLQEASDSESEAGTETFHTRIAGNVMQQSVGDDVAVLRARLERAQSHVLSVVTSLREIGEEIPHYVDGSARLTSLMSRFASLQQASTSRQAGSTPRPSPGRPLEERIELAQQALDASTQHMAYLQTHMTQTRRLREQFEERQALLQEEARHAQLDFRMNRGHLDRLRSERRAGENFRRVFGTREEMERDDYVSPIGGMFSRAEARAAIVDRDRRFSEVQEEEQITIARTRASNDSGFDDMHLWTNAHAGDAVQVDDALWPETLRELQGLDDVSQLAISIRDGQAASLGDEARRRQQLVHSFDDLQDTGQLGDRGWTDPHDFPIDPATDPLMSRARESSLERLAFRLQSMIEASSIPNGPPHGHPADSVRRGLDVDLTRPEPKEESELSVKMDCKICYTQLADTACLPCGHVIMCRWCSEQHSPTLPHDRTRPAARNVKCPLCRKGVKQKVRVQVG